MWPITSPEGTMVRLDLSGYSQYFSDDCAKVTLTVYDGKI